MSDDVIITFFSLPFVYYQHDRVTLIIKKLTKDHCEENKPSSNNKFPSFHSLSIEVNNHQIRVNLSSLEDIHHRSHAYFSLLRLS